MVLAFSLILLCAVTKISSGFGFNTRKTAVRINEKEILVPPTENKYRWSLQNVAFSLLPLAPGPRRKTILVEIVPSQMWTLDQIQGVVNVNVPVRSVVVKLKGGGLFVYNPVAPTQECLDYVKDLEEAHGAVKHIVLASIGLEHKALCGPFCRYFPAAEVWLQPGQWSFPFNLPNAWLGLPFGPKVKVLTPEPKPWSSDFDHAMLGPLFFKSVGGFSETAFFHKSSKTLLVTDAVVSVGDEAPEILQEDPRAILYHSRDNALDDVRDTTSARQKGWRRMALFGLFFYPSGIDVTGVIEAFSVLPKVSPTAKLLGQGAIPFDGGLFPWTWARPEMKNFRALQGGLLVAPILRKLILNREPQRVIEWADTVSRWPVRRIIPSHFDNNIKATGADFRKAFSFLEGKKGGPEPLEEDLSLLSLLSDVFTKLGVVAPAQTP